MRILFFVKVFSSLSTNSCKSCYFSMFAFTFLDIFSFTNHNVLIFCTYLSCQEGIYFIIKILTKYMVNSRIVCIPARDGPILRKSILFIWAICKFGNVDLYKCKKCNHHLKQIKNIYKCHLMYLTLLLWLIRNRICWLFSHLHPKFCHIYDCDCPLT